MSQENVELVGRIYDAWDREESAREFIAADVEYVNPSYAVEPGTRRGRKSFSVVTDTYSDFAVRVERFIDAGDDEVVVLARYTASGPVSGVPLEGEHGYVWTVQDRLAVRFQWFQSHREALEAAGLSESAMSEDENLAVVRRTIESFTNDVETWLDTLDPAVKWYPQEEHQTLLLGRDAALRRRERWRETFQEGTYGLEIQELRGNGENVFSVLREWGRGRGSGIEVEDHDHAHWKVRNGKIVYCHEYGTRAEALEAAGLSE